MWGCGVESLHDDVVSLWGCLEEEDGPRTEDGLGALDDAVDVGFVVEIEEEFAWDMAPDHLVVVSARGALIPVVQGRGVHEGVVEFLGAIPHDDPIRPLG